MDKLLVQDLKVVVEEKEVLRGVDLEVEEGQVHVVMGPNGSGKSTLAYAILGHPDYKITGGKIEVVSGKKKMDILTMDPDERAKQGLFLGFQNPVAIPGVSIFELLKTSREHALKNGKKQESIVEFYDRVKREADHLGVGEEFLKRSVNDGFSGGEKKKAETLQMMVIAPKFAILDEPDTGLDVDALKVVAKGVAESAKRGSGMLLITHYTRILNYLKPSRVSVLKNGKIVTSGGFEVAKEVEKYGYESIS